MGGKVAAWSGGFLLLKELLQRPLQTALDSEREIPVRMLAGGLAGSALALFANRFCSSPFLASSRLDSTASHDAK